MAVNYSVPRSRTDRRFRRALGLTLTAAVVAATATAMTFVDSKAAVAIPAAQSVCVASNIRIVPEFTWIALTPARSVFVGDATVLKAEAVADVGVDSGAEVRLGWSVNGSTPVEATFGPANFANHTEFSESRATFGLISVGAGTNTVQPFVRLSGASGKAANLLHRCFTVEGSTS